MGRKRDKTDLSSLSLFSMWLNLRLLPFSTFTFTTFVVFFVNMKKCQAGFLKLLPQIIKACYEVINNRDRPHFKSISHTSFGRKSNYARIHDILTIAHFNNMILEMKSSLTMLPENQRHLWRKLATFSLINLSSCFDCEVSQGG